MKKLFVCAALAPLAIATAGVSAEEHHPHWSYKGKTAPAHWGELQPDYEACRLGKLQTPINIMSSEKGELPAIGFNYTASPAEIVNNGHSVQANVAAGGTVKLAAGEYKLVQFHFHTPSEEKIKGQSFPMDAHLVHRTDDGKLAVVAVLFKVGKKDNPAVAKIFEAMPAKAEEKVALKDVFNPADLLPAEQSYYSFVGSLTTPPCSEGVQWQVLKTPVSISKAQLKAFQKLYPMNARPVQPLNGRKVEAS